MDKIPIQLIQDSPGNETYHLGTLELTKAEFANAEKINDLIDWCRELDERLFKLEGK